MGQTVKVTFGPNHAPGRSLLANSSGVVNAFVEATDGGSVPYAIYSGMGAAEFCTFSEGGANRGFHKRDETTSYAFCGEAVYRLRANRTATRIGTIQGLAPVVTAQNKKNTGPQIVVLTESKIYIIENDLVSEYSDADLPLGPISASYIDGYILFGYADGRFYISAINEANDVAPLDFAEAEGSPDNLTAIFVNGREVILCGAETGEVWVNSGEAAFPFERVNGAMFPSGWIAKHTIKAFDNTFLGVTNKGHVGRAEGYQVKRISNFEVEAAIQRDVDAGLAAEMIAHTKSEGGHEFYVLSGTDWGFTYDAATQLWHKDESHGLTKSRRRFYLRAFDRHLVGDIDGGKCYEENFDTFTEAGGPFVWSVRSQPVEFGPARIIFNALNVSIETGVGNGPNEIGESKNPVLMLRWSDDRGKSWDGDLMEELGEQGNYSPQVTFSQLGTSEGYGRIFELSCSSPVRGALVSALADIKVLGA